MATHHRRPQIQDHRWNDAGCQQRRAPRGIPRKVAWAKQYDLDARVIELALRESRSVIRRKNGVLITETKHGFLCANGGIDVSNVDGGNTALLLPEDPDRSAANLRRALKKKTGVSIPVIITDSFGRPWREGLTEVAIGIAGMKPLRDDRGRRDSHGYKLKASVEAVADELACAAGLICGKLNRTPAWGAKPVRHCSPEQGSKGRHSHEHHRIHRHGSPAQRVRHHRLNQRVRRSHLEHDEISNWQEKQDRKPK